jgi:uncharacterized protein YjdB
MVGCTSNNVIDTQQSFGNLKFIIQINNKLSYDGISSRSATKKADWTVGDTIYMAIDNNNDNVCYMVYEGQGEWKVNPLNDKTNFANENGALNALYSDSIVYKPSTEYNAITQGDILYTKNGSYTKSDNVVCINLTMNTRPLSRITINGISKDFWLDNCTEFVKLKSLYPIQWLSSSTQSAYNRFLQGNDVSIFYGIIKPDNNKTNIRLVNSDGVVYSRTYDKVMEIGKSIIINGPESSESSLWSAYIPVRGISLNYSTSSLYIGNELSLVATITPDNANNKNVTWSSNDTSIAIVDNSGKVTAVKTGTATITVTTEDGSKTATCVITVNTTSVTSVSLNKTTLSLAEGSSETLVATILPNDATNKNITWNSNNTVVATIDSNGKITAAKEGSVTITVKTIDGNKTASCFITVAKKGTQEGDTETWQDGDDISYISNNFNNIINAI